MAWAQKFLVVTPTPTWPLDHGNRKRVHQICNELQLAGHAVHLLFYPSEQDWSSQIPYDALDRMRQQWAGFHLVAPTRPLHPPPKGAHYHLDEWWDPAIADMLQWLFRNDHFDAMIVNYVWLSKALEYAPKHMLKIIDTHDRVGGRKEILEKQGLRPEFFYLTEQDEISGINRADVILAIKEEEADLFRKSCAETVDILTIPYFERWIGSEIGNDIDKTIRFGLIGAQNKLNYKSIHDLIRTIELRDKNNAADYKIVIAGGVSDEFHDEPDPTIEIMGRIGDVCTFYQACDVVVVPLTSSTGQKIRVGEALAFGKPLICHSHAFEGYAPTDDMHRLETIDAVAEAILAVSRNPDLISQLRTASRDAYSLQKLRVEQAMGVLSARCRSNLRVICFPVDDGLLSSTGAPWLRLLAAVRAAARRGRAVIWLSSDRLREPDVARLRKLAKWARLCASSVVYDQLCSFADFHPSEGLRSAESFGACLTSNEVDMVWTRATSPLADLHDFTICDHDLEEPGFDPGMASSGTLTICSRAGRQRNALYTPFFLGQPSVPDWRLTDAGLTVWIVNSDRDFPVAQVVRTLSSLINSPVGIWPANSCPPPGGSSCLVLSRDSLAKALAKPDLAIICCPDTLVDPLPLALLADAGAQCIEVAPDASKRIRRHAFQCSNFDELQSILDLIVEFCRDRNSFFNIDCMISPEGFCVDKIFDKYRRQ